MGPELISLGTSCFLVWVLSASVRSSVRMMPVVAWPARRPNKSKLQREGGVG